MDVRTPNGQSPAERGRRITAELSGKTVTISIRDSAGVRDTSSPRAARWPCLTSR